MKVIIHRFSIVLAFFLLTACSSSNKTQTVSDQSWQTIEKNKKITVATSGTLFPSSYYNDNNELTGYDVEVMKEIAKRLGVSIVFKEYNVDGQVTSVLIGETDLAAGEFHLTAEREKQFILSSPIKYSFNSMIVRQKDNSGIASLEDLKGKKAAGEPNTTYMKLAESYGATLVTYDNATNDQYLTDVATGRTDVIINDYYLQKMAVSALDKIPVKILDDEYFDANETGFLLKKDSIELSEKINETLEEMKEDDSLKKISETYFQTDVSVKPTEKMDERILDK